jgi:GNAT superfamily N-acetyltransferase
MQKKAAIAVKRISPDLSEDFYRLHSAKNGADWCFCAAWSLPDWEGWGQRTAGQNRAVRETLLRADEPDGYLLYLDGEAIGWCQCLRRDRLPKLRAAYGLEPDETAWAVTCILLAPRLRGQGLGHALLGLVLDDLRRRGIRRVEAFPRRGTGLPPEDVWTGPEGLFTRAGFHLERDDPHRPLYAIAL